MFELILIVIGVAIIYQSYKLFNEQKKLRKKMDDMNVEFSAMEGTGIEFVKKNYPNAEMKDDFRQKTSEPTKDNVDHADRHSISGTMNNPSEMQKKAFEQDNK